MINMSYYENNRCKAWNTSLQVMGQGDAEVWETAQATSIVLGYAIQLYGKTQLQDIEKKSISNKQEIFCLII